MALSKEHEATLRHLRQQVDAAQEALFKVDRPADAQTKLFYARSNLEQFVKQLRAAGVNI
jgi:hypothetical protein